MIISPFLPTILCSQNTKYTQQHYTRTARTHNTSTCACLCWPVVQVTTALAAIHHIHTRPLNGLVSGTAWMGWYQKKQSPTHTPILIIKHPLSTSSTMIHRIPLFNLHAWQSFSTTSLQVLLVWQQETTKSTANSSAVSEYSMVISLLTKQFTEHVARARAVPYIRLVFASAPNSGFTFGRTVCPDWIWTVGTHTLAVSCCTANTRDGV